MNRPKNWVDEEVTACEEAVAQWPAWMLGKSEEANTEKVTTNYSPNRYIPKPGDYFTVGRNQVTGDRSHNEDLLYCHAVTEGHMLVEQVYSRLRYDNKVAILYIPEYIFYDGTNIANKLTEMKLKNEQI